MANMNSIRMVLAVCMAFNYIMEQLDADTAFLNYGLRDIVYMAASAWNKIIDRVFLQNGFKNCEADQCVYAKRTKNGFVYGCLYVDDMIIAAKTVEEISEVKDALNNAFKMKKLGTAKFILNTSMLMIKPTRYIDDVAERFGQKD
ncbi:Integrase catalytic core protein [Phytophthora palmivora]|uniref:Integrase catalytic core protein n=1 Tax=Phytophthora palmivora TaxID=4796 RepID=A0A2P4Y147_9STRA|nr:Integrase catalytic core protein [Phytophthora palmivora]